MLHNMKNKLIVINGTSCAGKSSVARRLVDRMGKCFVHFTWDSFLERLPSNKLITDEEKKDLFQCFVKEVRTQLDNGQGLILDIVCVPASTFQRLLDSLQDYDPFTVRIRASVDVLKDRESKRKDRRNGQAEEQHIEMYSKQLHPKYDLEVNSTHLDIDGVTQIITNKIRKNNRKLKMRCSL